MKSNIWFVVISNRTFDSVPMRKLHLKNWIKEIREERGMTLEELAQKVGVSNPYVSMLELSKRGLSVSMLHKLAEALECHPTDIISGPGHLVAAKDEVERDLLTTFRGLEEREQSMYLHMLKSFSVSPGEKNKKK